MTDTNYFSDRALQVMPYWRLAGFYFFYFSVLGVLVPYGGLYLKSIGFTPVDIGTLMAVA